MRLNQITLPCLDIAQSREFYLRMGFTLIVDSVHYLRFLCEEGSSTFSLHLSETEATNHSITYFECNDLEASYQKLIQQGFEFSSGIEDQPWGWREVRLLDPSGNQLCLYFAGENRINPPWRVTVKQNQ